MPFTILFHGFINHLEPYLKVGTDTCFVNTSTHYLTVFKISDLELKNRSIKSTQTCLLCLSLCTNEYFEQK